MWVSDLASTLELLIDYFWAISTLIEFFCVSFSSSPHPYG